MCLSDVCGTGLMSAGLPAIDHPKSPPHSSVATLVESLKTMQLTPQHQKSSSDADIPNLIEGVKAMKLTPGHPVGPTAAGHITFVTVTCRSGVVHDIEVPRRWNSDELLHYAVATYESMTDRIHFRSVGNPVALKDFGLDRVFLNLKLYYHPNGNASPPPPRVISAPGAEFSADAYKRMAMNVVSVFCYASDSKLKDSVIEEGFLRASFDAEFAHHWIQWCYSTTHPGSSTNSFTNLRAYICELGIKYQWNENKTGLLAHACKNGIKFKWPPSVSGDSSALNTDDTPLKIESPLHVVVSAHVK